MITGSQVHIFGLLVVFKEGFLAFLAKVLGRSSWGEVLPGGVQNGSLSRHLLWIYRLTDGAQPTRTHHRKLHIRTDR
jgi:hypothetical protein